MKKQSRSLSVIHYGHGPQLHDICDIDPTKCLRECVGSLPLYAVMNSLMRMTMNINTPTTEAIPEKEGDSCHKEPHLKTVCTTPISLQVDTTPPGTGYANQHTTTNDPLPAPPQLAGSGHPPISDLPKMEEESSDDFSSVLDTKDQSFMLSSRQRKGKNQPTTYIGKEYDAWLLALLSNQPITTNRFLTLQKSFLWEFPVTPNIFATVKRSSKWNDALAHLYEYVQSINSLDINKVHPSHSLYRPALHQLQAWCTLLKCADGAPLFDKYRARLTSKVSSLAKEAPLLSTSALDVSLESVIQTGKRLEEFIINVYTVYLYE